MSPDTLGESITPPPRTPYDSHSVCFRSESELFDHTEKTGDKKTPLSGAHGLSLCACAKTDSRGDVGNFLDVSQVMYRDSYC